MSQNNELKTVELGSPEDVDLRCPDCYDAGCHSIGVYNEVKQIDLGRMEVILELECPECGEIFFKKFKLSEIG